MGPSTSGGTRWGGTHFPWAPRCPAGVQLCLTMPTGPAGAVGDAAEYAGAGGGREQGSGPEDTGQGRGEPRAGRTDQVSQPLVTVSPGRYSTPASVHGHSDAATHWLSCGHTARWTPLAPNVALLGPQTGQWGPWGLSSTCCPHGRIWRQPLTHQQDGTGWAVAAGVARPVGQERCAQLGARGRHVGALLPDLPGWADTGLLAWVCGESREMEEGTIKHFWGGRQVPQSGKAPTVPAMHGTLGSEGNGGVLAVFLQWPERGHEPELMGTELGGGSKAGFGGARGSDRQTQPHQHRVGGCRWRTQPGGGWRWPACGSGSHPRRAPSTRTRDPTLPPHLRRMGTAQAGRDEAGPTTPLGVCTQ